jgi:hypothetical protein
MNTYQSLNPKSLIGKVVIFRGAGEAVEIEEVKNGEFIGKSLLRGGDRTEIDCDFLQDGVLIFTKEEAEELFKPVLALIREHFEPSEETEAEREAVNV